MLEIFYALILTIALEFLISIFFLNKDDDYTKFNILFYLIIINTITNPVANFIHKYVVGSNLKNFFIIEFFVVFIEMIIIKILFNFKLKKSLLFSLLINSVTILFSFFV